MSKQSPHKRPKLSTRNLAAGSVAVGLLGAIGASPAAARNRDLICSNYYAPDRAGCSGITRGYPHSVSAHAQALQSISGGGYGYACADILTNVSPHYTQLVCASQKGQIVATQPFQTGILTVGQTHAWVRGGSWDRHSHLLRMYSYWS